MEKEYLFIINMTFIDYKKAFDLIDHIALIFTLLQNSTGSRGMRMVERGLYSR